MVSTTFPLFIRYESEPEKRDQNSRRTTTGINMNRQCTTMKLYYIHTEVTSRLNTEQFNVALHK